MAYQPFYTKTDWQNLPSQRTALNRTNLLHVENGIKEADNRIVQLDAKKAEKSDMLTMVKDVTLDTKTGILKVTLLNGTVTTYDLDIEKVVTNFDIDDQNQLVLTLADGTKKAIDLTRFVYSVDSTATISMTIRERVMSASIIDGSVTMEKLDAAIQTEFRQYLIDAQAARDAALQYQKYAKRYTLGDGDYPGSETDNARYYQERTKADAATSGQNASDAAASEAAAKEQAEIAVAKASAAAASANSAAADALTASAKAQAAGASEQAAREKAAEAGASQAAADQSAGEAADSAQMAKRYAVGGVVPEDAEDNARWYWEQTKNLKSEVDAVAKIQVPRFYIDFETGELMSDTEAKGIKFWIEDGDFLGEVVA